MMETAPGPRLAAQAIQSAGAQAARDILTLGSLVEELHRKLAVIREWADKQSTYDADIAGLQDYLDGRADTPYET